MSTEAEKMDAATLADELQFLLVADTCGKTFFGESFHTLGIGTPYAGRAAAVQTVADDDEALWLYETTAPGTCGDRPWLSARAPLTAAFCLTARAAAGDLKAGRHALAQGRELAAEVSGESERLHLAWLTARARARRPGGRRVGEAELAELIDPARRLWPWCEVSLLTLDLCVCRTPAREGLDLAAVEKELKRSAPSAAGETTAGRALVLNDQLAASLPLWDMAALLGRCLRNTFRLFDPAGIRPIPFLVPWSGPAEVPAAGEATTAQVQAGGAR